MLPQEHAEYLLLRKVSFDFAIPWIFFAEFERVGHSCQIRELADEEKLQDTELQFKYATLIWNSQD